MLDYTNGGALTPALKSTTPNRQRSKVRPLIWKRCTRTFMDGSARVFLLPSQDRNVVWTPLMSSSSELFTVKPTAKTTQSLCHCPKCRETFILRSGHSRNLWNMLQMATADISAFPLLSWLVQKSAKIAGIRLEVGPETFSARVSATSFEAMGRIQ